ncbi:recombinase RecX [Bacteroidia bacterium]|nr:recombinase RecX [Bacteroidia bacterium]
MDLDKILSKAQKYCDYQERCTADVQQKLRTWDVSAHDATQIINLLTKDDYLNEERFATAFVRDKILLSHYGKNVVKQQLQLRKLPTHIITRALTSVPDDEYHKVLQHLLAKRQSTPSHRAKPDDIKQQLLIHYAIGRGFEYDLVKKILYSVRIADISPRQ